MRSIFAWATLPFFTLIWGGLGLLAALFRVRAKGEGDSIYDFAIRSWCRSLIWASGVKIVLHGTAHVHTDSRIFVANHVSRFDVLSLGARLHKFRFVAKAELERIPFFGKAAKAVGTIYVERQKNRASIASLEQAASQIDAGASVIMFPEGTRSPSYELRHFKKGPFVLAISAGTPIVPTIIHGTLEVHPKGEWRIRSGRVDIHFLEPVPVAGLTYEDRDRLAVSVRERMAIFLRDTYGVGALPGTPAPSHSTEPLLNGASQDPT